MQICRWDRNREGSTSLDVFNVEDEFVGISLTEQRGLSLRRVSLEIHDVKDLVRLRDEIDEAISHIRAKAETVRPSTPTSPT